MAIHLVGQRLAILGPKALTTVQLVLTESMADRLTLPLCGVG